MLDPPAGEAEVALARLNPCMPAAIRRLRGQGTLVAVGFPSAALVAIALWLDLHGAGLRTTVPAALVLVALTVLAEKIDLVVAPRMTVSTAGGFLVAAALVGGPLIGACAGASIEAFAMGSVWRPRCAWGGAYALQGFLIGLVGEQLTVHGPASALGAAALGLLTGFALGVLAILAVALDRGVNLRAEILASWRAVVLIWLLPAPLLVAFVFLFRTSPELALGLAAGLLLVLALGNRLRLNLEQRLAEERLRARRDALTDAPNRYALDEALAVEQARIRRGGRLAAICFLDLDRFRDVNNTFGYAAGDQLLVDVYHRLCNELRETDLVFRWGGEEFVVLAPHVEHADLSDFAERLRLFIAARPFSITGRPRTITASVGAVLLDESRPAQAALEAASKLARKAKLTRNTALVEAARIGDAITSVDLSVAAGA
jgi:diguanylate cyclase (GGDEF)-like protein